MISDRPLATNTSVADRHPGQRNGEALLHEPADGGDDVLLPVEVAARGHRHLPWMEAAGIGGVEEGEMRAEQLLERRRQLEFLEEAFRDQAREELLRMAGGCESLAQRGGGTSAAAVAGPVPHRRLRHVMRQEASRIGLVEGPVGGIAVDRPKPSGERTAREVGVVEDRRKHRRGKTADLCERVDDCDPTSHGGRVAQ